MELKDLLYYSDLMYELQNIAGFDMDVDFDTLNRISERKKDIKTVENVNGTSLGAYSLSSFEQELFMIVKNISKKVGVSFKSIEEISKYPLAVMEALTELEKRQSDNIMISHLKTMIADMGLEHSFSLGEPAEQRVCLDKNCEMWEVYLVERGNTFEKTSHEECYDACVKVLEHLSDSKQMLEKSKDEFSQVKKLSLKK